MRNSLAGRMPPIALNVPHDIAKPSLTGRSPRDLLARYFGDRPVSEGFAMSCGTLSAIGGIRPASEFRMALHDPLLNRTLEHHYVTGALPVIA